MVDTQNNIIHGRYKIIDELGRGGMGVVYRAQDLLTKTQVAIKRVLVPTDSIDFGSNKSHDELYVALSSEFRTLASLWHPNIVSVRDFGFLPDKSPFYTMQYIENATPILEFDGTVDQIVDLIIQMLEALQYLHHHRILHRDLKPDNVLLKDNVIRLLDFGLAVIAKSSSLRHETESTTGTLTYMAPEVLMGKPVTSAADLYAIGLIAFQLFGAPYPFPTENIGSLVGCIISQSIDVDVLDVNEDIKEIVERLLSKSAEERYASADIVIRELCFATNRPPPRESIAIRESFLQSAKFVGREAELAQLTEALDQLVTNKQGSAWLIGGESGVGKSRLVDEFCTRAQVAGALVLRGQAIVEGGVPFQVWRNIIRYLVVATSIEDDELHTLKVIVPDIDILLGRDIGNPLNMDPTTIEKIVPFILGKVITKTISQFPLVIVVEDLQWASESLTLLKLLLQQIYELPVITIGTFRNDEKPNLPDNLPNMTLIELTKLGQDVIAQLLKATIGSTKPELTQRVYAETGGNAFFVVEILRALAEDAGGLLQITEKTLPEKLLAQGIEKIISQRLANVPAWTTRLLQYVAVGGRQLDLKIVNDLIANHPSLLAEDNTLSDWFTVCNGYAILEYRDDMWHFSHDRLREYILKTISSEEVALAHEHIALAIERVYAEALDDYAPILFQHWAHTDNEDKQRHYVLIAGRVAQKSQDNYELKRLMERAYTLGGGDAPDEKSEYLAEACRYLGSALVKLGDPESARHYFARAMDIYEILEHKEGLAYLFMALGSLAIREGNNEVARDYFNRGLEYFVELNNHKQIGDSYLMLGIVEYESGHLDSASNFYQKSYDTMLEIEDNVGMARALHVLAVTYDMLGDIEKASLLHEQALSMVREHNDRSGIGYILVNITATKIEQGDYITSKPMLEEALGHLRVVGDISAISTALYSLGNIELFSGNFETAHLNYQESLKLRRQIGNTSVISETLRGLGVLDTRTLSFESARGHFTQAIEVFGATPDENGDYYWVAWDMINLFEHSTQDVLQLTYLLYAKSGLENHTVSDYGVFHKKKINKEITDLKEKLSSEQIENAEKHAKTLTVEEILEYLSAPMS